MIASRSHQHRIGIARNHVASALLAVAGISVFTVVLAALAARGNASSPYAQEIAGLARLAPYVLAFAVAHGVMAYIATSPSRRAQRAGQAFAMIASGLAIAGTLAVFAGWRLFVVFAPAGAWDRTLVPAAFAALYAAAAYLLRSPSQD